MKKLSEETNDKHQKKRKHSFLSTINIYDNLTYINVPFMTQLSRLCFSDSGYYYDDKKDVKKLDSGDNRYVSKNICSIEIFNFTPKPTLFF